MGYIRRTNTIDLSRYKICVVDNTFAGEINIVTTDLNDHPNSGSEQRICCVPIEVSLRGTVRTECKCAPASDYVEQVRSDPHRFGRSLFELDYDDQPLPGTKDCPRTTSFNFGDTVIKGWCEYEVPESVINDSPGVPLAYKPAEFCPEKVTTKDINITIDLPETFAEMTDNLEDARLGLSDNYGFECGPPFNNLDYHGCPCEHIPGTRSTSTSILTGDTETCYRCRNTVERYVCLMTTLGCDKFEGGPRDWELANIVRQRNLTYFF